MEREMRPLPVEISGDATAHSLPCAAYVSVLPWLLMAAYRCQHSAPSLTTLNLPSQQRLNLTCGQRKHNSAIIAENKHFCLQSF